MLEPRIEVSWHLKPRYGLESQLSDRGLCLKFVS
jgi:hypothetical protein